MSGPCFECHAPSHNRPCRCDAQAEISRLQAELASEKALADRLAVQLYSYVTTEYWSDGDDDAITAYRKARGL